MALKSGGTVPPARPALDANQVVSLLAEMHHWSCRKVNSNGDHRYTVSITHAGCRVSANRQSFVAAAKAAMAKLRERDAAKNGTRMKLVG